MGKHILLVLFVISNPIIGQEYDLYVEYRYVGDSYPFNSDVSIEVDTAIYFNEYMESPVLPADVFTKGDILASSTLSNNLFWEAHINFGQTDSGTVTLGLAGKSTFMLNDGGRTWSGSIKLLEKITLSAPSMDSECYRDKITIQASLGHPTEAYTWYYSAEGYAEQTLLGTSTFQNISLADLYPDPNDQIDLIDKPIVFRLYNSLNDYSVYTTYTWKGCSPELIDTDPIVTFNETCFGSNDGGVVLTFKDNILPGSQMRFFVYDGTLPINPSEENLISENPEFPGTGQQTILDPIVNLTQTINGYSGTLNGLSGSSIDPDNTVNNFADYFIVYQEVDYNVFPPKVKSGEIIPRTFRIERPSQLTLDTLVPDFFTDTTCGMPAIFNMDNTASGGNNLVSNGYYSYEYSLDNGIGWTTVASPDHILEIAPTKDPQSVQLRGVYTAEGKRCAGEPYRYLVSAIDEPIIFTDPSTGTTSTSTSLDGSVRIALSGGTIPYSYSLSRLNPGTNIFDPIPVDPFPVDIPNGTAVSFNDLPVGIFRIAVTDDNGCLQISPDLIIGTDPIPVLGPPEITQLDCMDSYGSINVPILNFNTDYRYQWTINGRVSTIQNSNAHNIILNNISVPGVYTLKVSAARVSNVNFENDTNIISTSIQINEPLTVDITSAISYGTKCNDTNDGIIDLTVSGGISYEYTLERYPTETDWYPLTETMITDLAPGYYQVTVRNQDGCESNTLHDIYINRASPLEIAAIKTDVTTYRGSQGSISLDIIGGEPFSLPTGPYTITWQKDNLSYTDMDLSTPNFIDGLTAGSYSVTVSDANGCIATEIYRITQPDLVEETIVPPSCWDGSNGRITVLVNQGNGDYTYSWDTGEKTSSITNLTPGNYTVTINGLEDGSIVRTYMVEAPPPLILDMEKSRTICNGQDLVLDAKMEGDMFTYSWTSDIGFVSNDSSIIVNLAGTYMVTVASKNGCSTTETIYVDSGNDEINAEFAMSSQVFVGESFIAVDLSYPLPEAQEWILPAGATVVKRDSDEVELLFNEAGEYEIGIITKMGICTAQLTKKVLVVANNNAVTAGENDDPKKLLEFFTLHPNPTTGKFVADVLLPETGAIGIKVFNFANNALMARQEDNGATSYSLPMDLSGLPAGIYAVVLETPFGNALRKIILN